MNIQKGSAHVVVVGVLVLALLGALGFIFWQNFVSKDEVTKKAETIVKSEDAKNTARSSGDSKEGYLVLTDWGVKFKIPDDIGELTYYKQTVSQNEQGVNEHYEFSTKNVEALGGDCVNTNESGSVTRLAYLSRSQTKAEQYASSVPANDNNPVGDYYYMVSGGQSLCSERQGELQLKARDAISDMLLRPIDLKQ